jgi:hypothetical protein
MNVKLIPVKIKERLNKLDSSDYDNISCWQFIEAFNKAQIEWTRNQINGINQRQEGSEATRVKVDDLQVILKPVTLLGKNTPRYFETTGLPKDYLNFKRATPTVSKGECKKVPLDICFLREEANAGDFLSDSNYSPSFSWRETFCTLLNNKLRVYTNGDFLVDSVELLYYRFPRPVNLADCESIDGTTGRDVDPEFKDDIVELIVDYAASIIAGDIESMNQFQRNLQSVQKNT